MMQNAESMSADLREVWKRLANSKVLLIGENRTDVLLKILVRPSAMQGCRE